MNTEPHAGDRVTTTADPTPGWVTDNAYAAEELGSLIGSTDGAALVQAIQSHTTGPVIELVEAPDGTVTHRSGWAQWVDALGFYADDDKPGRFIFGSSHNPEGFVFNPIRGGHEARPRHDGDLDLPDGDIYRYVGGFVIRTPDGGSTTLVLWNDVLHETVSGDIAPGFGPIRVEDGDQLG